MSSDPDELDGFLKENPFINKMNNLIKKHYKRYNRKYKNEFAIFCDENGIFTVYICTKSNI